MAILKIIRYPDPVLREVSHPVEEIGDVTRKFIDALEVTMYAHDGAGLSAVQVGSTQRIFVVNPAALGGKVPQSALKQPTLVFVNPEIVELRGEPLEVEEGCLSIPDVWVKVTRPAEVVIRAQNRYGTEFELAADGFQARIIQHEYDHLDGKLTVDYAHRPQRRKIRNMFKDPNRRMTKKEWAKYTRFWRVRE